MDYYKWYKDTELPTEECNCVVVWNVPDTLRKTFHLSDKPAKQVMRYTTNVQEGRCTFDE